LSYPRTQQGKLPAYFHTIPLMLNVKQGSCEYQLLKSFGLTGGGGGATRPDPFRGIGV